MSIASLPQSANKVVNVIPNVNTGADPGFPVGGEDLLRGCFSVKMCVKTKELVPVSGEGECNGKFCM